MIPLTVNEDVAAVLGGYADAVEVRDEKGQLLGHFLPYLTPQTRDVYEHPEKYFDLGELERAAAAKNGPVYTYDQVMQHLRSLDAGK